MSDIRLQKLDLGFNMDVGSPDPTYYGDEDSFTLEFYIRGIDPDRDLKYDSILDNPEFLEDEGIARIKFSNIRFVKFGDPNDEANVGHRYYELGIEPYEFFEVINSEVIEELKKINNTHPNYKEESFNDYKHYILFFHDSCFEIVSSDMLVTIQN